MGCGGETILGAKEMRNILCPQGRDALHDMFDFSAGGITPQHAYLSLLHGIDNLPRRAAEIEAGRNKDIRIQDHDGRRHVSAPSDDCHFFAH
jgi:hypothetical protein